MKTILCNPIVHSTECRWSKHFR